MTINTQIIKAMEERYAVKGFDSSRRISDDDINTILEAMRLSPSSFGLQPWKFFIIESDEVKKQLGDAAPLNRPKLESASHILIFARRTSMQQSYVDQYFDLMKTLRNQSDEDVKQFYDMVSGKVASMPQDVLNVWTSRQVYIALGSAIMSAALLGVDGCPMEGIDPPAFDKILGLEGSEYATTVGLSLGYRSSSDPFANFAKVRFAKDDVIQVV